MLSIHDRKTRVGVYLALAVSLAACSGGPTPRVQSTPPEQTQASPAPRGATGSAHIAMQVQRVKPLPAATALIAQSRAALQEGAVQRAWQLAEQAQRISPQAAEVYLVMAEVRLAEGSKAQARYLLQKARSLAGQDARLLARIGDLSQQAQ